MQAMAQQVGLNMTVEVVEFATQLNRYFKGDYQLMVFNYTPYLDPLFGLDRFIGDKTAQADRVWGNPQAIELLAKLSQTSSPEARQPLFDDLHRLFIEDSPMVVWSSGVNVSAYAKAVGDMPPGRPQAALLEHGGCAMTSLAQRTQQAWPDGARCVIGLTLDFDGTSLERGRDQLPFGARSHGRYSAKCGIPRFVDMFTRQQVPWTFYVSGYDAEESPDLVRSIARSGIEIGSHGYLHEGVDPGDAEPELLERTHKLLTDITGIAPTGWRSPSGHKTARTLHKLRELGYVYDSSDKDFDLPYLLRYGGQEHDNYVCLPNNTRASTTFRSIASATPRRRKC
jgi:hypothetical protein